MEDKIEHLKDLLFRLEDRSLRPGVKLPEGVMLSSDLTIAHTAREEITHISDIEYISAFKELLSSEKITVTTWYFRITFRQQTQDKKA